MTQINEQKLNISNMTIEMFDGRKFFWQWDAGCKLRLIGVDVGGRAHFYRDGMTEPLTVVAYAIGEDVVCDVPDEILQIAQTFAVYTYVPTQDGGKTYISRAFHIKGRPKPVDYIYTPTDFFTVEKAAKEALDKVLIEEKDKILGMAEEAVAEAVRDITGVPVEALESLLWTFATNGSHGLEYTLYDNYAESAGIGDCKESEIEIGSMVKGLPVTKIGEGAFDSCEHITHITIPNSVTSIGQGAFNNCSRLTYNKYDSALYLGNDEYPYLFLVKTKDTSITSCVINDNTKIIYDNAFDNCKNITSITIPDNITHFGRQAFKDCSKLTSVYITDLAKWCSISAYSANATPLCYADNLYLNGNAITDLIIPNGVTSIGDYAFYDLGNLTSVSIPDSVTAIGRHSFYRCNNLKSVAIPNSVTYIGENAFQKCSNLSNVTIGNSVTTIENAAFYGCSSLTSIIIPDSLKIINMNAFCYCSNLTSIIIGNGVTTICPYAFDKGESLTDVYYRGTKEEWDKIAIDSLGNEPLINATIHYNYGG